MQPIRLLLPFLFLAAFACNSPSETPEALPPAPEIPELKPAPPAIDTSLFPLQNGYYQIDWSLLARVDFEQRWHDTLNDYIYFPIFHEDILAFNGQPVQIGGYVIPFEETQDEQLLVLSAFPFSSCFFCGNAGPESVMDVQLQPGLRGKTWKQDSQVTFRGRLRLNDTDVYYLNYILEDAAPL